MWFLRFKNGNYFKWPSASWVNWYWSKSRKTRVVNSLPLHSIYIYIYIYIYIVLVAFYGISSIVGNLRAGSNPGCIIRKTQKMVVDASLFNIHPYKICLKVNVKQSRERSCAFPTPRCSRYWKESLRVALNRGCHLYLLYYIYIYMICKYVL